VNAFLDLIEGQYTVLNAYYQVILQKIKSLGKNDEDMFLINKALDMIFEKQLNQRSNLCHI